MYQAAAGTHTFKEEVEFVPAHKFCNASHYAFIPYVLSLPNLRHLIVALFYYFHCNAESGSFCTNWKKNGEFVRDVSRDMIQKLCVSHWNYLCFLVVISQSGFIALYFVCQK